MLTKKLFFILISLVMVLGLTGPATAKAPQNVECRILWVTSDYQDMYLMAEGELITNGHGFELDCDYDIDFSDPVVGSIEQFCEYWGPWACNAHGNNIVIQNVFFEFEYNGESLEIDDNLYMVNANGQLNFHAQYAPDQCNEYKSYNFTLEFPPGYWENGLHTYTMEWSIPDYGYYEEHTYEFTVDESGPLYKDQVRFGWIGPRLDIINPAQDTFMQITSWIASDLVMYLEEERENSTVTFSWDGGDPVEIQPSAITNFCGFDNAFLQRTYGYAK